MDGGDSPEYHLRAEGHRLCRTSLSRGMQFFFFSSRRRHTRYIGDWSSDVCSSDLLAAEHRTGPEPSRGRAARAVVRSALLALAALATLAGCRCDEAPPVRVLHPFPERYAGVGLELKMERGWPVVVRLLAGGSAFAAGIRDGDTVVAIEEESTYSWELADVVAALRGE